MHEKSIQTNNINYMDNKIESLANRIYDNVAASFNQKDYVLRAYTIEDVQEVAERNNIIIEYHDCTNILDNFAQCGSFDTETLEYTFDSYFQNLADK